MKKVMCSVFDNKAAIFSNPFYSPNVAVASRDFLYASKDPDSALSRSPEDFSLFVVGEFDDVSGLLTATIPPQFVVSAVSDSVEV